VQHLHRPTARPLDLSSGSVLLADLPGAPRSPRILLRPRTAVCDLLPKSSTTTLSLMPMTVVMWCSTSNTVSHGVSHLADRRRQLVDLSW
jgi:hypothetical protein